MGEAAYLFLLNGPRLAPLVADAHGAEDGHRDAEAALAKAAVLDLGGLDRGLETGRKIGHDVGLFPALEESVKISGELKLLCILPG